MDVPSTTHATLLARLAQSPGQAAWEEFYQRYGELIRSFARRQNLQPADCDDVLQEVLLSLTRAMPGFSYDPRKGKFRSYLKTTALRAIFKRKLRGRGEVMLEHIEEATQAASSDEVIEQHWEAEWRDYHVRLAMRTIQVEFNTTDRAAFERYALRGTDAKAVVSAFM